MDISDENAFYKELLASSLEGMCITDSNGNFEEGNSKFFKTIEWPEEDIAPGILSRVANVDYRIPMKKWLKDNSKKNFEAVISTAKGKKKAIRFIKTQMNFQGHLKNCITLDDQTSLIFPEEQTFKGERRPYSVFRHIPIGMAILGLDGKWISVNSALCRLLGYSQSELLEMDFQAITYPEDLEKCIEKYKELIDGKIDSYHIEKRYTRKDGAMIWARVLISLVRNQENEPLYFIAQIEDINSRKLAENALEISENKFRTLFENTSDSISIYRLSGQFIEVNQAACDLLGYSRDELLKMTPMDLYGSEFILKVSKSKSTHYGQAIFETSGISRKGTHIPIELKINIIEFTGEPTAIITARDLSKQKKKERVLHEHIHFVNELLNVIPAPIFYKDRKGLYLGCNRYFENFIGMKKEDIIGRSVYDLSPGELAEKYHQMDQELFENEGNQTYEFSAPYADGTIHDVIFHKATFTNTDGDVAGLLGVMLDITERKLTEKLLEKEKNLAQNYLDIAGVMIVSIDANQKVTLINKKGSEILGCKKKEIIGKDWFDVFIPHRYKQGSSDVYQKLMSGEVEAAEYFENPVLTRDGEERLIAWNNTILKDENGKISGVLSSGEDITQQKEFNRALKESEAKFRNLFESASDAIFINDLEGNFLEVNDVTCEKLGYTREEMLNLKARDIISREDIEKLTQRIDEILNEEHSIFEIIHIRKDGSKIPTETSAKVIEYSGKKAILSTARDITERKRAEEMLQESEERYRALFQYNSAVMLLIDPDTGDIVDANPAACTYYGYSRKEITHIKINDINMLSEKQVFEEMEKARSEKRKRFFFTHRLASGEMRSVEVYSCPIMINDKKLLYSIIHDITDRKKVEEELVNAKMEAESANRAKSDFLANMSHELRTPLNSVIGFSDILLTQNFGPLSEKQLKYIGNISTSGKHLLALINDILDLSKVEAGKMELHLERLSVSNTIGEVKAILSPQAYKKNIVMDFKVSEELNAVIADKSKFKQILYNLMGNSIKFTPEGGSVTVEASPLREYFKVSVIDNGIGIPKEDMNDLFKPFVQLDSTASKKYEGTGLGLAIVKRFVKLHGGNVWASSEYGKGSTFSFTIPLKKDQY